MEVPCFNPRAPCGARHHKPILHIGQQSFNPRAPCGARRGLGAYIALRIMFQSTRPMRGATMGVSPLFRFLVFQSTRPMRGATQAFCVVRVREGFQSTRPMRGATCVWGARINAPMFQSTRPMRGATVVPEHIANRIDVSIHAPHAGRDISSVRCRCSFRCFNPRAPCGARQQKKLRLPSFATYLWVLLATNMIFSMSEQHTLLSCAAST